MASTARSAKCVVDLNTDGTFKAFRWDPEPSELECAPAISVVLGGMTDKVNYLDGVELFAPNSSCHGDKLPAYPFEVVGSSAAYAGRGAVIVCGGASGR